MRKIREFIRSFDWRNKSFRERAAFFNTINVFLIPPTILLSLLTSVFQVWSAPLVIALSLPTMLIISSAMAFININQAMKETEKEIDESLHALNKKHTEKAMRQEQERLKSSYDKDTQKAMEQLFGTGSNSAQKSSNSSNSAETVIEQEQHSAVMVNELFSNNSR